MSEQKICCECKNFTTQEFGARCKRVIDHKIDVVWGLHWVVDLRPCVEIRADESSCGPEGKFFEKGPDQPTIASREESNTRKWWGIFA